ncbi:hypothetical protein BDQ17DRAFT_1356097 [Cyathus striatus]|nr:hypothetical protein BDQ17DRAFT_1356097 [Cyathus striatus]
MNLVPTRQELKDDSLVTITIPACHDGVEDPDGHTQVLIRHTNTKYARLITEPIDPIPRTSTSMYRIGTTPDMGKGMFATRCLLIGDLITSERPLLIAPILINRSDALDNDKSTPVSLGPLFEDMLKKLFDRMSPTQQAAFNQLANSHVEDEIHPFTGKIRTNGMEVDLSDKNVDADTRADAKDSYLGICNDISRCNHSCAPNAYFIFDLKTFCFQLRAMQTIEPGDEITISYTPVADTHDERMKDMAPYSFQCQCSRCIDPEQSDRDFEQIMKHAQRLPGVMESWRSTATTTQKMAYDLHYGYVQLMEEKGLQSFSEYKSIVSALYIISVECGDENGARRWGSLLIDRIRAEIPVNREKLIPHYNHPDVFKAYSSWNCRQKKKEFTAYMETM